MSYDSISLRAPLRGARLPRALTAAGRRLRSRPELIGVLGVAAVLDLWGLSINGWANTYYAAAVRSMTSSWHDFLFASLDRSGLMTVDKPPLSLWVQALSARVFGFGSLSILVPQALMGVAATGLTYDLARRRFGRPAGFAAGLALAITPIAVAVSRHNNPDELLTLCCVAALWCAVVALETGRTRWLVLSGICVGLGFETKMGVALMVVPGIALAYLWIAPQGRPAALRQLLVGGAALAAVGLAWPVLVTLTPAADRPWIAGTADNSIWSLIFGYNGLGRIAGQSGGPAAVAGGLGGGARGFGGGAGGFGGASTFGGPTGVFRLLQSGLGDQAGWLLGFAVVAAVALLALSRLRRGDPRTGWLIAVGGALLTCAVVFSLASGIFHPYYVSLLAPFAAALVGAGAGEILRGGRPARFVAPLAIAGGVATELVVIGTLGGALSWAKPVLIGLGALTAALLAMSVSPRVRVVALSVALAALFAAPAVWAADTLGHATSGTFPAGGPVSASAGGPGGFAGLRRAGGLGALRSLRGFGGGAAGGSATGPLTGPFGAPAAGAPPAGSGPGGPGGLGPGGPGGPGGLFGGDDATLRAATRYAQAHGGGTIAVSSQSSAAAAILASGADVAGLGGFSGRESSVTASWVAMEVRAVRLRWVIADAGRSFASPADSRPGSRAAMQVVAKACRPVTVSASGTRTTMYDCRGRSAAILAVAAGRSS